MTTWSRICRICSSSADYDIFAKIPTYLHSDTNEFLNWQKPINLLIEEATGLKVSKEDGLPENICALCISYLKHAINFREQTINNALNLKIIMMQNSLISYEDGGNAASNGSCYIDKATVLVTADDLAMASDRETDVCKLFNNYNQPEHNKVKKQLLNNALPANVQNEYFNLASGSKTTKRAQNRYKLASYHKETGVDEDFQTTTTSGEESEDTNIQNKHNFFSYEERNFEEDDVIDMDELRDAITINIPETCKERKCRACFKRFMFEDTYNDHMQTCIELKFLNFIEEINRLLEIRRGKSVSPHEFIRRMIFALRKICEWLKQNCVDIVLSEIIVNTCENITRKRMESEVQSLSPIDQGPYSSTSNQSFLKRNIESPLNINHKAMKKDDLHIDFDTSLNSTFETIKIIPSGNGTPININNNILYEIERSESRQKLLQQHQQLKQQQVPMNMFQKENLVQKPIPLMPTNMNTNSPTILSCPKSATKSEHNTTTINQNKQPSEDHNLLLKLQRATIIAPAQTTPLKVMPPNSPRTPMINVRKDLKPIPFQTYQASPPIPTFPFSARCNPCDMLFETLALLELHNAMNHNSIEPTQNIPLQEEEEETNDLDDEKERDRIIALFEESSADED